MRHRRPWCPPEAPYLRVPPLIALAEMDRAIGTRTGEGFLRWLFVNIALTLPRVGSR
jgi:hypothetical protein